MVLDALGQRGVKKRPAAAGGGGRRKKQKVGEAYCQCEASRSQWLGRVVGGGKGSTRAFNWKEHGGMEKAHAVALKWVADSNKAAAACKKT